jgi:PAS domain S-box-containing protein
MSLEVQLDALRRTFDPSPDPVVVLDVEGRVLYANRGAQARWSEGDTIDRASSFGASVLPLPGAGEARRAEWGDVGPGGTKAWYACSVAPLTPTAWLCVSTDITELKRNEERLRLKEQLMVDTQGVAHLGTWEWDVSEPHAYWSAELYRIYGLTPETYTPTYEGYLLKVHPDDRQRVADATNRVFREHVPYSHDERIFRPDGSMRHLHTWAFPVLDDQGQLRRLIGVCQDITDRALAEEQVRRMNVELERRVAERTRQLETSMRDLEAFNAMVSHDLRTPMNVIALALPLMNRPGATPADVERAHARAQRAINQMSSLIEDLLAFARLGDAILQRVEVDASALVREIVTDLRHAHPDRNVEVVLEDGITCLADRSLMRVALQNLVGNAWKYTALKPAAEIRISTAMVEGRRVLVVRDNGAGFDMKDAHRMFAPFQRLHSDREFAGTGVGLASVQRIFERHGARVWAEGAPGQGATFFVELHDAPAKAPRADEPVSTSSTLSS